MPLLGAALSYALSAVFARRVSPARGLAPLATATGQIATAAVVMLPIALIVDRPWTLPLPGPEVLGAVLGLAALATCLAYVIYYRILATAGAVNLMLVTFLIPVSAILLGTLVLGERLVGPPLPRHGGDRRRPGRDRRPAAGDAAPPALTVRLRRSGWR